jgi:hypothetical protein
MGSDLYGHFSLALDFGLETQRDAYPRTVNRLARRRRRRNLASQGIPSPSTPRESRREVFKKPQF